MEGGDFPGETGDPKKPSGSTSPSPHKATEFEFEVVRKAGAMAEKLTVIECTPSEKRATQIMLAQVFRTTDIGNTYNDAIGNRNNGAIGNTNNSATESTLS